VLVDRRLTFSGRRAAVPGRSVELTIVVESEVRPWRFPARVDFQYGDWLRDDFERGEVEPWPTTTDPDLAVLLTIVLQGDRPVLPTPSPRWSPGSTGS
jgi:streptomycin 3"-adenylyltransferase